MQDRNTLLGLDGSNWVGFIAAIVINIPASIFSRKDVENGSGSDLANAWRALLTQCSILTVAGMIVSIFAFGAGCFVISERDDDEQSDEDAQRPPFLKRPGFAFGLVPLAGATIVPTFVLNTLWTDDSRHTRVVAGAMPVMLLAIALGGYKSVTTIKSQCETHGCRALPAIKLWSTNNDSPQESSGQAPSGVIPSPLRLVASV